MSWTLCTSGAAVLKAGLDANSLLVISGAPLAEWSDEVEGMINTNTRKDWVAGYSAVGANFKGILADTASDLIGMKIINYDMSGYPSRLDAQTRLDVLKDNSSRNIETLKDEKNKEVM